MAGSKQPIELVIAKGNKHLTKAEIEERKAKQVRANNDNIKAPSYLPDDLVEEFNRIANELIEIGIMSNLDCEALARYISTEHQYEMITSKLLKMKSVNEKYFELLNAQDKLIKMCRSAANDLGLTISSRCKLVMPKKEEEQPSSKWSKYGVKNG